MNGPLSAGVGVGSWGRIDLIIGPLIRPGLRCAPGLSLLTVVLVALSFSDNSEVLFDNLVLDSMFPILVLHCALLDAGTHVMAIHQLYLTPIHLFVVVAGEAWALYFGCLS